MAKYEDPSAGLNKIDDRWQAVEKYWRPQHGRIYKNMAFLVGKQYIHWDAHASKLYDVTAIDKDPKKIRVVFNKIFPIMRVLISEMMGIRPVLRAEANTKEPEDVAGAKVSDKAFKWLWQHLIMEGDISDLAVWMWAAGVAYMQPYWNPNIGQAFEEKERTTEKTPFPDWEDEEKKIQRKDASGNDLFFVPVEDGSKPKINTYQMGDIENAVYTPFEIYPDPRAIRDLRECGYVFKNLVRSPEWVYENYGVEAVGEKVDTSGLEQQLRTLLGGEQETVDEVVHVREYYERPCNKYPNGIFVTLINDKIVKKDDYSLPKEYRDPYDWCPIVKFDGGLFPPGRLIKMSIIEALEPVQKQYNVEHSTLIKHLKIPAKYFIPIGTKIDEDKLTTEENEKIWYNPMGGVAPHAVPPPFRGNDIWKHLDLLQQEFMDISGVHEVSQAQTPTGVKSGKAIGYLQEQDIKQRQPILNLFGTSLSRWGKKGLRILQVHYQETRTVTMIGKENREEVFEFKGVNLNLNCDLKVNMESAVSHSKAARAEMAMELGDRQWITPQQAMKMMGVEESEEVWQHLTYDEQQARFENDDMLKGIGHTAASWHNHTLHLMIHNEIRKKAEFLPNFEGQGGMSQATRDLLNAHCTMHEEFMRMMQQAQAQRQAGAGGGK